MSNRVEQLKWCRVCAKQQFDRNSGIVCSLTGKPADFETTCENFLEDVRRKAALDAATQQSEVILREASKAIRLLNYLIDSVFVFLFVYVFAVSVGIVMALLYPQALEMFKDESNAAFYLFSLVAGMVYFVALEAGTGRTLAKFITGTRVVDGSGKLPSLKAIIIRSASRFVPFDFFSFLGEDSVGWHDRWSGTRVVLNSKWRAGA